MGLTLDELPETECNAMNFLVRCAGEMSPLNASVLQALAPARSKRAVSVCGLTSGCLERAFDVV